MVSSTPLQLASTVKGVAVVLAFGMILYMLTPPFYWKLAAHTGIDPLACSSCLCNCLPASEAMLLPGYGSSPFSECARWQEDVDRRRVDLLAEELKLHEVTAEESERRAEAALLEVKKVAAQYQKEAEKCSSGMETSEEARERSDAALLGQKKIAAEWERRARQLGWRDKPQGSLLQRIGFSSAGTDQQQEAATSSFLFSRRAGKL